MQPMTNCQRTKRGEKRRSTNITIVEQLYYDIPHLVQRKDLQVAYAQK